MDDLFARFIEQEFEWIYEDEDVVVDMFLEALGRQISKDEFYENFEVFKNQVVNDVANNEWLIQQIHECMDDMLRDVLKDYLLNK